MSQPKRIFIIGQSGAGKGVLAKALAKQLGWQFIDADFSLVASMGRPLTEIIGKEGEESFIQCLSDTLAYQTSKKNIVVTTDDSIVCSLESRLLLSREFSVYLRVSTAVQLERIGHNRPLLPGVDYKAFLDKLHHERNALFEQVASCSVNSDDNALEEHVRYIVNALGQ